MQDPLVLRPPDVHLLCLLFAPLDHFKECDQRLALIVVQIKSGLVGYPAVNPPTAGVDPEQVAEAESICIVQVSPSGKVFG